MRSDTNGGHAVDRIAAVLAAIAPDLGLLPAGGWGFTLANGWPVGVRARVVGDEWLELTTRIKGAGLEDADEAWRLLALNARLAGAPRVAATSDGSLLLRGEGVIDTDSESTDEANVRETDVGNSVQRLCDDFRAALHELHNSNGVLHGVTDATPGVPGAGHVPAAPGGGPVADGDAVTRLVALCAEAGWAATGRASGEVAVIVETRHAAYQARLSLGSGDSFQALVTLGDVEPTTIASRAATARLLLGLSGAVRLVKGVVTRDGDAVRPGIAAACAPPRTGADMARVLSALSVACGLAGREIRALTDQGLAGAYLTLGGPRTGLESHGQVTGSGTGTVRLKPDTTDGFQIGSNEEERVCLQQK